MEENEIPSTSRNHFLHVVANKPTRQRISFYADVSTTDTVEEKKTNYRNFIKRILYNPKLTRRSKRSKRNRSMFEHTHFEEYSAKTTCPNCLNYIETDVKHYNTCMTHLIAISLLPVCMCFVPYYSITCKDTVHSCPRCEIYLGTKFSRYHKFLQRLKIKKSSNNNNL